MEGLIFNAEEHRYFLGKRELPGCTEILKAMGLRDYRFVTEEALARGSAVHLACHYLDTGVLNLDTLGSKLRPYVQAYQRFKMEKGWLPKLSEHQVASEAYSVAGTLDKWGVFQGDPRNTLLDIKTGEIQTTDHLQTALYALMLMESDKMPTQRRLVLGLRDDGSYRTEEGDSRDTQLALSAVTLYHYRRNHGLLNGR